MTEEDPKKFLTKAELLAGTNVKEEIFLPDLNGYVTVKALSAKEFTKAQARRFTGIKQTVGGRGALQVDLGLSTNQDFEGNVLLVHASLVGEPWTEDDVRQIPQRSFNILVKAIERLSGASPEKVEDIANFRKV